jgi:hypothetical protein
MLSLIAWRDLVFALFTPHDYGVLCLIATCPSLRDAGISTTISPSDKSIRRYPSCHESRYGAIRALITPPTLIKVRDMSPARRAGRSSLLR